MVASIHSHLRSWCGLENHVLLVEPSFSIQAMVEQLHHLLGPYFSLKMLECVKKKIESNDLG